MIGYEVVIWL